MFESPGLNLAFLKKESYSGSYSGKRYYLAKEDENLFVCVYPEPWCYEKTAEEMKRKKTVPYTKEGLDEALKWIETIILEENKNL